MLLLKLLWPILGLGVLLFGLYQASQEALWTRRQLVRSFSAYLETSGGERFPITSTVTVVGTSRRLADLVPALPGARTFGQKRPLAELAGVHCQLLWEDGRFSVQNLQDGRYLTHLPPHGNPEPLASGEKALLQHGSKLRLCKDYTLWFYEGESSYAHPQ